MFKPAFAVYKRDGNTSTAVQFDQETVEFKHLNDKVQERWDAQKRTDAVRGAEQEARHRAKQRQQAYDWFCTMSMGHLILRVLVIFLCIIWKQDGFLPGVVAAPVSFYCFCSALIRIGVWIEKARNLK